MALHGWLVVLLQQKQLQVLVIWYVHFAFHVQPRAFPIIPQCQVSHSKLDALLSDFGWKLSEALALCINDAIHNVVLVCFIQKVFQ